MNSAFRTPEFQAERKTYIKLRGLWHDDPERYCRQRLGLNPSWQQQQILSAVGQPGAKVSVRTGHGIGKSSITAAIICWFLETRDYPRCACTAPSSHQLRDILWAELAKWRRHSEEISRKRGDHPVFWLTNMFKQTQDRLCDVSAPDEWYAVARTARKDNPEALQGLHASDIELDASGQSVERKGDAELLFVIEEASGVHDSIFEVAEGALSSPDSRVLMIGNPTRNTGHFASSHKHMRGEYTALHFRSQDSPLVTSGYRESLVKKYGEDSNVVRVRSDGEFPKQDDDSLISVELSEAATHRNVDDVVASGPRRLGIDVARFGSDRTAFVCRQGQIVDHIAISAKQETMETAGQAIRYAKLWQIDEIYVDVVGLGAGVYDRLNEVRQQSKGKSLAEEDRLYCDVYPVNVAESVPTWVKQDDDARGRMLRDYLWIQVWQWLRDESPAFLADKEYSEELAGELTGPKMKIDSSGRIVIESKDDMKKRGLQSPDIADALCCSFAPAKKPEIITPPNMGGTTSRWSM